MLHCFYEKGAVDRCSLPSYQVPQYFQTSTEIADSWVTPRSKQIQLAHHSSRSPLATLSAILHRGPFLASCWPVLAAALGRQLGLRAGT